MFSSYTTPPSPQMITTTVGSNVYQYNSPIPINSSFNLTTKSVDNSAYAPAYLFGANTGGSSSSGTGGNGSFIGSKRKTPQHSTTTRM